MFKSICKILAVVLLSVLAFSACTPEQTGPNDAKTKLNDYIKKSFSVKGTQDRTELLTYLNGEKAKARLAAWSDDQSRLAFVESKRQFQKLVFKESEKHSRLPKHKSPTKSFIQMRTKKGSSFKVTNKKMALNSKTKTARGSFAMYTTSRSSSNIRTRRPYLNSGGADWVHCGDSHI